MKQKITNKEGRINYLYSLLFIIIFLVTIFSITIGVADITVSQTLEILIKEATNQPLSEDITSGQLMIIKQIRIPRVLMAILTGANLAVTGAIYQSLFRNAMADPFMLGISSGASLGAGVAMMVGGFIPGYAFIGALLANVCVTVLSGTKDKVSTVRLLLGGMAINYFFSSILSLIRVYATDRNLTLFSWGMGSLSGASYERISIMCIVSFPILIIFFCLRKELNLLNLGEEAAQSMGLDTSLMRKIFLGLSSLLIATTVAFTGTIGFVGLIIPHMVRLMFGSNYKRTLGMNLFFGILFMLVCDNLSRALIDTSEIPIGIITSLFGAPYFMYLIYRDRKRSFL